MARKSKKKSAAPEAIAGGEELVWVDPARIRFQHARIRPYFSGCGRSVTETLESIRREELKPQDLPPIQVIIGPDDAEDGERWYFSLNNRRLWVLKRCREEGFLCNNQIQVRVRSAKSSAEAQRYTLDNCAVDAKFIRERNPNEPIKNDGAVVTVDKRQDVLNESTDIHDFRSKSPGPDPSNISGEHDEMDESASSDDYTSSKGRRNPFAISPGEESDDSDSDDDSKRAITNQFSALLDEF